MGKVNKAHTATVHRIAKRYNLKTGGDGDIAGDGICIEVETTASISEGIHRLAARSGRVYVAITNKEGLQDALRLAEGTRVGVMNPQGDIIKECSES
jgi:rRNA-processing protein FCF1